MDTFETFPSIRLIEVSLYLSLSVNNSTYFKDVVQYCLSIQSSVCLIEVFNNDNQIQFILVSASA